MSTTSKKNRNYIAAVVLIIIIVAGVGYYFFTTQPGAVSTTSSMTSVAAMYKDTIVIGTTDSIATTIDPAETNDYLPIYVLSRTLGGGLVDYRPGTTEIIPSLATDWTTSSDGMTWTFNLRQGVKFADGTPFNATVMKYSMDRQMAIDLPQGQFAGIGLDKLINKTVVTGPYQVQFVLNQPFSAFLAEVAYYVMFPVNPNIAPMHAVVNYTGNVNTEVPNDIGPYVLTNWQRTAGKDIEMDFAANPNWWKTSSGYTKTKNIIYKFYSDSTSLSLALQSGEIDIGTDS